MAAGTGDHSVLITLIKAPALAGAFALVGHPLLTRALSNSPQDCLPTGCSSFLPAGPCPATAPIVYSAVQKPTQRVGSDLYGREKRPFSTAESCFCIIKKCPRKSGGYFYGGPSSVHPRPMQQSAGLLHAPLKRRRAVQVLNGLLNKKTSPVWGRSFIGGPSRT